MLTTREVVTVAIIVGILTAIGTNWYREYKTPRAGGLPPSVTSEDVVRFEDKENGTVCYVHRPTAYWRSTSISCVKK